MRMESRKHATPDRTESGLRDAQEEAARLYWDIAALFGEGTSRGSERLAVDDVEQDVNHLAEAGFELARNAHPMNGAAAQLRLMAELRETAKWSGPLHVAEAAQISLAYGIMRMQERVEAQEVRHGGSG